MKKRRLGNSEESIEYVKEFIGELEEGPIRKRLPKSKKMELKLENKQKAEWFLSHALILLPIRKRFVFIKIEKYTNITKKECIDLMGFSKRNQA
jgi:hypothetical protein